MQDLFMLLHVFMCFGFVRGFVMVVCGDAEPRLFKLLVPLPGSKMNPSKPK